MKFIQSLYHLSNRTLVFPLKAGRLQLSSLAPLPILTLYTKKNCSLCDEAVEILKPHWDKFKFETVDIEKEGNEVWHKKYCFDIPVFHLNGKFLMKHRANTELLLTKIKEYNDKLDRETE